MFQVTRVLRTLRRLPVFTAIAVITIAIAIGANTAIFSVVHGILLKPLPYRDPDRLVGLWQSAPGLNIKDLNISPSFYFTFREENRTFERVGMWSSGSASVTGLAEPEQVESLTVTEDTLPALGVSPSLGRAFNEKDALPGNPETAILSYGYWQRRFGADASALGRSIVVNGRPREIIGVMPQGFRFLNHNPDLIVPYQFERAKLFLGNFGHNGLARLKPGVTLAQANADVARMIPIVNRRYPAPPGFSVKMFEEVRIVPNVRPLMQDVVGEIGTVLWLVMGTVGVVLLIACANVANLVLVRAEGRQRELAVRMALGAGVPQIARELLLESLILGLIGGALGLGLAFAALQVLIAMGPATLPRLYNVSIDGAVLLFTLAVSLLAGLLFGLIPVLKYAGPSIGAALHGGGRSATAGKERHRARDILVVAQVALALVLLISSGLIIRTSYALKEVQPGFRNPRELQTLRVFIPDGMVKEPERAARMHRDILENMARIPGVTSASLANSVPTDGVNTHDPVYAEDRTYAEGELPPIRRFKYIAPGFFATMGNPLIAGRELTWTDIQEQRPVAIVSENLARELWRDPRAAVGKRVRQTVKSPWFEIVGVARNVPDDGAAKDAPSIVYWPYLRKEQAGATVELRVQRRVVFVIRGSRPDSETFLKQLRESVWAVSASLPVADMRRMDEIYAASMARTSFALVMLSIAGAMALVLGLVGIYGVISYSVSQRTREMGIRMALGARQRELRGMFVRRGLLLAAAGVACGLVAAVALSRVMASLLFGVRPVDPATYSAVSLVLIAVALAASYVPARRASAVDAVEALRAD